ncbi:hypothetical protein BB561_000362 [Smittium simulii]|uniref:serine C-palmitoyltransferase n=1 Tax=Smittium simulii TaxID=133385 RepID=A0A2T9YZI2_9FUNG|nr:hypothetical protein BB561_000362 [Smittium simulii]
MSLQIIKNTKIVLFGALSILLFSLAGSRANEDSYIKTGTQDNFDSQNPQNFFSIGARFVIRYIKSSYRNDPFRTFLEACLVFFIIWYVSRQKYRMNQTEVELSEKEVDELISEWKPEPLVRALTSVEQTILTNTPIINSPNTIIAELSTGTTAINFTSFDFLGIMNSEGAKAKAVQTLRNYGVGPCGPPGFFGTLDVHIELETTIAQFLKAEAAILYSQGMAVCVSVIPCFSKRGDIIVADEKVNFMLQQGIKLSRSKVYWYKHNDMEDLDRVLALANQNSSKKKGSIPRKFIISEGLFQYTGNIIKLNKVMELKNKHKFRLILDDSLAIGVLGSRGAGSTDHFNISAKSIDLLIGSLWGVFGGAGGFCCASKELIGHQRLSGLGYVFSAAMPAIMAITASDSIKRLEIDYILLLSALRKNISTLRNLLNEIDGVEILGDDFSPVIHVELKNEHYFKMIKSSNTGINTSDEISRNQMVEILCGITNEMQNSGVLVVQDIYIVDQEHNVPKPSIRILLSGGHSIEHLEKLSQELKKAIKV